MPPAATIHHQVSESLIRHADQHRESFLNARPFRHVMIENFFAPALAERLLSEFPTFDRKLAMNEMGELGGKAVNTKIREISPAYEELYEMIGSREFLDLMSRLSGIPDLLMDPKLYGGGTHENRHGQELDAHVDFNYDEAQQLHRRLNVIVYMNKEWKTEWGGAIEIHSNPWDHKNNQIHAFDPLFNRCVMFETNEYSWHGFPKIELPEDKRHLSRKSISIYLYTKDRPAEEIAPMHATFYVQRPLPPSIQEGRVLTRQDVADINMLLKRRDDWLRMYHKMELEKNRELAVRDSMIKDLTAFVRVPLTGYALQTGSAIGAFADRWMASHAEFDIQPLTQVSGILLRGWRPENAPPGRVRLSVGSASTESPVGGGSFEVALKLSQPADQTFRLNVDTQSQGRAVESNVDSRDLAFLVTEIRARHPLVQTLTKMLG
jgi:2-oxoglutarate-Fe(II)-dependent oxygenase superfamily protein